MLSKITVNYNCHGVDVTLVVKDDMHRDMSPYDLGQMFARVIRDTNLNHEMVIEQLKDEFEYDDDDNKD